MKKYQTQILLVLRLLIAFLFLFSAYAKLYPIAMMKGIITFETNHLIPMGFSEGYVPYFSRFIIGLEFFIGVTILFNYYLKKFIIPLSVIMITAFSIHLLTQIGSSENCGCNGELLPMTPLQALIKNSIALIVLIFMYKKSEVNRGSFSALIILFLTISTIMFAVFPASSRSKNVMMSQFSSYVTAEDFNVDEGKKILYFFNPTCEHCQEAAQDLHQLSTEISDFPEIHVIFSDDYYPEDAEAKIDNFFKIIGGDFSYEIMQEYDYDDSDIDTYAEILFLHTSPVIIYLEDGNQIRFYTGDSNNEFNSEELKVILDHE